MSKKDTLGERLQSAARLRQIRENAGLTQDEFSEILGISLSAYKKVESGENQVSLSSLRKLYEEMSVSADFVLYGKNEGLDEAWEAVLNCSETDKMFLMLRLLSYFTKIKKGVFPLKEEQVEEDKEILQMLRELQNDGED